MHLTPGMVVGHYRLSHMLGTGGMAEVSAATHDRLGISVALKVLFSPSPMLQERLLREGRAQVAMEHPNLLGVHDVVQVGGSLGLVLPLVEGPGLDAPLEVHTPTKPEAIALFRAVVSGSPMPMLGAWCTAI
jgi:serine/threonine protein kinase